VRTNTQNTSLPVASETPYASWSSYAASPRGRSRAQHAVSRRVEVPVVYVIDADQALPERACEMLEERGYAVHSFADGASLLQNYRPSDASCLLIDATLRGMSSIELTRRVKIIDPAVPVIIIDGHATLATAILAMRAGAVDLIEEPFSSAHLLKSIERVLPKAKWMAAGIRAIDKNISRTYNLTHRQTQILELVLNGSPNKNIAADLGISQRTVENHRAAIMKKTGSRSVPDLVRATLPQLWGGGASNH